MAAEVRGRFYVDKTDDGWQVVDSKYAAVIGAESKRAARGLATFFRSCVKKQGDVNLFSAPYSDDDPFTEDDAFMVKHQGCAKADTSLSPCADPHCECRSIIEKWGA